MNRGLRDPGALGVPWVSLESRASPARKGAGGQLVHLVPRGLRDRLEVLDRQDQRDHLEQPEHQ